MEMMNLMTRIIEDHLAAVQSRSRFHGSHNTGEMRGGPPIYCWLWPCMYHGGKFRSCHHPVHRSANRNRVQQPKFRRKVEYCM